MVTLARRDLRGSFADVIDLLEAPWTMLRPISGHPVRVEDFVRDGRYVVRAELPGIDPDEDLEVTVCGGVLMISAERRQDSTDARRSEFRYGSFSRSVTLPAGANEENIEATYGHGILEVTVRLDRDSADKAARKIPVRQNQHIKAS